jgi:hypothetical protein
MGNVSEDGVPVLTYSPEEKHTKKRRNRPASHITQLMYHFHHIKFAKNTLNLHTVYNEELANQREKERSRRGWKVGYEASEIRGTAKATVFGWKNEKSTRSKLNRSREIEQRREEKFAYQKTKLGTRRGNILIDYVYAEHLHTHTYFGRSPK